jgi:TENA/THI-4/PQQC family
MSALPQTLRSRTGDGHHCNLCRRYIVQDYKFLDVYGRALSLLASKADDTTHASFLASASQNILQGEMELHRQLMAEWGISTRNAEAAPMQPSCLMYTSYLMATVASRPFHEGEHAKWLLADCEIAAAPALGAACMVCMGFIAWYALRRSPLVPAGSIHNLACFHFQVRSLRAANCFRGASVGVQLMDQQ